VRVTCECGRKLTIPLERLGQLGGNMAPVKSLKLVCRVCGARNWKATLFVNEQEAKPFWPHRHPAPLIREAYRMWIMRRNHINPMLLHGIVDRFRIGSRPRGHLCQTARLLRPATCHARSSSTRTRARSRGVDLLAIKALAKRK
jgi:hypothetical protein